MKLRRKNSSYIDKKELTNEDICDAYKTGSFPDILHKLSVKRIVRAFKSQGWQPVVVKDVHGEELIFNYVPDAGEFGSFDQVYPYV